MIKYAMIAMLDTRLIIDGILYSPNDCRIPTNENARPVLTGIKFEIKSNEIKLIAIDGSRLAIRKAPIISVEECDFSKYNLYH